MNSSFCSFTIVLGDYLNKNVNQNYFYNIQVSRSLCKIFIQNLSNQTCDSLSVPTYYTESVCKPIVSHHTLTYIKRKDVLTYLCKHISVQVDKNWPWGFHDENIYTKI